jgi:hypothetical protein
LGTALPQDERDADRYGDDDQPGHQCSLVRHGREVDGEDEAADERDRQDATQVVDGL